MGKKQGKWRNNFSRKPKQTHVALQQKDGGLMDGWGGWVDGWLRLLLCRQGREGKGDSEGFGDKQKKQTDNALHTTNSTENNTKTTQKTQHKNTTTQRHVFLLQCFVFLFENFVIATKVCEDACRFSRRKSQRVGCAKFVFDLNSTRLPAEKGKSERKQKKKQQARRRKKRRSKERKGKGVETLRKDWQKEWGKCLGCWTVWADKREWLRWGAADSR